MTDQHMISPETPLSEALAGVIAITDPRHKAEATRALIANWHAGAHSNLGTFTPPERPGRPARPELRPPRDVPRRRITQSAPGRIALIHAIAHIELNAIDLSLDMACRFVEHRLPRDFYVDWLSVADDEARHFLMLDDRLSRMDAGYGDLPAHDGLWQAAQETAHDLLARLAIAPLVLEARGLDVTPGMIEKLRNVDDNDSADALGIIMEDEIGHVAIGKKWFDYCCGLERRDPVSTWQSLVGTYFRGPLKPPFNIAARTAANFAAAFYAPMAERDDLYQSPPQ
ncbi:ferritin-like domain-containing protein [Alphaproteobacteria bacterium]|nr:ferritin-like domain-containing protein [Alphaproteobacteria bacterium]